MHCVDIFWPFCGLHCIQFPPTVLCFKSNILSSFCLKKNAVLVYRCLWSCSVVVKDSMYFCVKWMRWKCLFFRHVENALMLSGLKLVAFRGVGYTHALATDFSNDIAKPIALWPSYPELRLSLCAEAECRPASMGRGPAWWVLLATVFCVYTYTHVVWVGVRRCGVCSTWTTISR